MIDPTSASVSALTAFKAKMKVTSNNVANVLTDGFKKSRVTMEEGKNGGVKAAIDRIDSPGISKEAIRDGEIVTIESSNVDLTEEMTAMIATQHAHAANLKTLKVHEQMLDDLMDFIG